MGGIDTLWVVFASALVFLMQGGFLCLESGMTRSKNSINVGIKNLADFCLSTLVFWTFGFGLMYGLSYHGWIGLDLFAIDFAKAAPSLSVFFLFQLMFCVTSVKILSGVVAERMKFGAYLFWPSSSRGSSTPSRVIGAGRAAGALADRAGSQIWDLWSRLSMNLISFPLKLGKGNCRSRRSFGVRFDAI